MSIPTQLKNSDLTPPKKDALNTVGYWNYSGVYSKKKKKQRRLNENLEFSIHSQVDQGFLLQVTQNNSQRPVIHRILT